MGRYADVVVVGAGAAGLAVAHELRRRDVPVTVLDRVGPGASWAGRHEELRLNTVRWLSGLRGHRLPRRHGRWVARDDYVAYLRACADDLDVVRTTVERIDRDDHGGWRITTEHGDRHAAAVVMACGFDAVPHLPDWPGSTTWRGTLVHAADHRRASEHDGRTVLVAGAGTSGLEIAVAVAARRDRPVDLAVRSAPLIFPREWAGAPLTPLARAVAALPEPVADRLLLAGHRMTVGDLTCHGLPAPRHVTARLRRSGHGLAVVDGLPPLLEDGRIRVVPAVTGFDTDAVLLADGSRRRPDVVIAATGYRRNLGPLVGHLGVLDEQDRPRSDGPPGLYFVGYDLPVAGQLPSIRSRARDVARRVAVTPRPPRRSPRCCRASPSSTGTARAPAPPARRPSPDRRRECAP